MSEVDRSKRRDSKKRSDWSHVAIAALLIAGPVVSALLLWMMDSKVGAVVTFAVVAVLVVGQLTLERRRRRKLDESLRARETETRALFETAPDGIVAVDIDGVIHSANQAAAQIFSITREELLGARLSDLVPSIADAQNLSGEDTTSILLTRGVEHRGRRLNGQEFPLEVNTAFLPKFAGKAGMVLVFRDLTERKQVEERLRDARDQALAASEAKSQFLANMSHELRTPLNGVIGYAEMIREEIEFARRDGELLDAAQFIPELGHIGTAGKHLLGLVNDILDLSKIEAGRMHTEVHAFALDDLLDEVTGTIEPLADKNGNEFSIVRRGELGIMHADEVKVRQSLFNLLSNACKFTSNGRIDLTVDRGKRDGEEFIGFKISDTGIGMTDEQLERVFDAFTQADNSTTRNFGGTGLGLTITHHICQALGGDIEVESVYGEGTTFWLYLKADLRDADEEMVDSRELVQQA